MSLQRDLAPTLPFVVDQLAVSSETGSLFIIVVTFDEIKKVTLFVGIIVFVFVVVVARIMSSIPSNV